MNLYDENGWPTIAKFLARGNPFNFIVGSRQIGKTYTSIKDVLSLNVPFIFLRKKETQLDAVLKDPKESPFVALQNDGVADFNIRKNGKRYNIFVNAEEEPRIMAAALSTFSNLRGFSGRRYQKILYDEFIGEKNEKPIPGEYSAFVNLYMTVNSVRELQGEKPVQCICLANSDQLLNPLFVGFKLVTIVEKMKRNKQNFWEDPKRGILIINAGDSPKSKAMEETALFRAIGTDNEFSKMALYNEYTDFENDLVSPQNLKEYKPLIEVGEICIYKHKSKRKYYACGHVSGSPKKYDVSDADLLRLRRDHVRLWFAYLSRNIVFESFIHKALFEKYFNAGI